jgi:hypothetical protein
VSGHVPPHRWADAAAGRVEQRDHDDMTRHAESCTACAKARAHVAAGTGALASIRAQTPPELPWETIRTKVYWEVFSEFRSRPHGLQRVRPPLARPWAWAMLATAAAAAGVYLYASSGDAPMVSAPVASAPVPAAAAPAPALAGIVSRLSGDVLVDGIPRNDDQLFAATLPVGTRLATGDGRIDVQLGAGTAASLGPRSTLALRRVDDKSIELVVEGTVDVEVAPRAPGQRFLVIAGDDTVEVHGTQFRVRHDAQGTAVACRHGLVSLRDAHGEVQIATAKHVEVAAGHVVEESAASDMSADELAQLALATPVTTPSWGDPDAALHATSALEVITPGKRAVRVDGVERGDAPMRVRVMPGRHLVEAADSAGRFKRVDWVEVGAGSSTSSVPVAAVTAAVEAVPMPSAAARRQQLRAGIEIAKSRLAHCVRAMTKAGLGDTYVQIEIAVDASGAVGYLNVVDTDLPSATAGCVREALADIRFAAGDAASWRERIDL